MGQLAKKYHITESGDIYKVNDDGSFTAMGNAEKRRPRSSVSPKTATKKKKSKHWLWFITLPLVVIICVVIVLALHHNTETIKDTELLGLRGDVESVEEASVFYELDGTKATRDPEIEIAWELFDFNPFVKIVFGGEGMAEFPFNYLLFFTTNTTFTFNETGYIKRLIANNELDETISFTYNDKNELIQQNYQNNRNYIEVIQYDNNQIIGGYFNGAVRELMPPGEITISKETEHFATILFDKKRIKRMYLPNFWREDCDYPCQCDAEYIFKYNNNGWIASIFSRTGSEGCGQTLATFTYGESDSRGNWTKRIVNVEAILEKERYRARIVTTRNISYRN